MKVNGEEKVLEQKMNLKDFLVTQGYDLSKIAVEYNGKIAPKTQYKSIELTEADTLEVVSFVGGG